MRVPKPFLDTSYLLGNFFYGTKLIICWSKPLYTKNTSFWNSSNSKMNVTILKSSKNWSIKWYGLIWFEENFSSYNWSKFQKKCEKCWISKINVISTWNISRIVYRNISNYTIFSTSCLSFFEWCHSFLNQRNYKNWYFWCIRALTSK